MIQSKSTLIKANGFCPICGRVKESISNVYCIKHKDKEPNRPAPITISHSIPDISTLINTSVKRERTERERD